MKPPPAVVELTAQDVQGPGVVACPNPKMALWSNHPRVFIDIATTGEGKCAYCGTVYHLTADDRHAIREILCDTHPEAESLTSVAAGG